jgi:hypothetical protein
MGGIADAVAREVDWLTTTGDGLPALQAAAGGPFEVLQGRWPRTAPTNKRALYVVRLNAVDQRTANIRSMVTHQFVLKLLWPMTLSNGSAEDAQEAFDAAIDQVVTRINGPLLDKTHGNRFLSVAENPGNVRVDWDDPEQSLADGRVFRATVSYPADDFETNN